MTRMRRHGWPTQHVLLLAFALSSAMAEPSGVSSARSRRVITDFFKPVAQGGATLPHRNPTYALSTATSVAPAPQLNASAALHVLRQLCTSTSCSEAPLLPPTTTPAPTASPTFSPGTSLAPTHLVFSPSSTPPPLPPPPSPTPPSPPPPPPPQWLPTPAVPPPPPPPPPLWLARGRPPDEPESVPTQLPSSANDAGMVDNSNSNAHSPLWPASFWTVESWDGLLSPRYIPPVRGCIRGVPGYLCPHVFNGVPAADGWDTNGSVSWDFDMDASDFIDRNFSLDIHYFAIPEDADGFTIKQQLLGSAKPTPEAQAAGSPRSTSPTPTASYADSTLASPLNNAGLPAAHQETPFLNPDLHPCDGLPAEPERSSSDLGDDSSPEDSAPDSGRSTDKERVTTDDESDVVALDFVGGSGPRQFIRPDGPDGCIISFNVPDGLHFYGLDIDGDPIFRRLDLCAADFSTQCNLHPWDDLSFIRWREVDPPFPIWPDLGDYLSDSIHFFSAAVKDPFARGKFSVDSRSRRTRTLGCWVCPVDFLDPFNTIDRGGVPPIVLSQFRPDDWSESERGADYSEEEYSYDPYDKE